MTDIVGPGSTSASSQNSTTKHQTLILLSISISFEGDWHETASMYTGCFLVASALNKDGHKNPGLDMLFEKSLFFCLSNIRG